MLLIELTSPSDRQSISDQEAIASTPGQDGLRLVRFERIGKKEQSMSSERKTRPKHKDLIHSQKSHAVKCLRVIGFRLSMGELLLDCQRLTLR